MVQTHPYEIKVLLLVLFLSASAIIHAQKLIPALPESAGFSPDRLKRIDAAFNDWVKKGWMNGAVGMVVRNGKIVYYKSAGYNDLNTKTSPVKMEFSESLHKQRPLPVWPL